MADDDQDILDAAKSKPTAGCCIIINGLGKQFVLDEYEDVIAKRKEAEPLDLIDFMGFVDFSHTEERVTRRISYIAAAIVAVEEWGEHLREGMERDQALCQEQHGGPGRGGMMVELPGWMIGGGGK
jgi:hypothetical protein